MIHLSHKIVELLLFCISFCGLSQAFAFDPFPITDYYIECRGDGGDRAMTGPAILAQPGYFMTVEACMGYCAGYGYPYSGLEFANQCMCGTSYTKYPVSSGCDYQCMNDTTEICGAIYILSVYNTPPAFILNNPAEFYFNPGDVIVFFVDESVIITTTGTIEFVYIYNLGDNVGTESVVSGSPYTFTPTANATCYIKASQSATVTLMVQCTVQCDTLSLLANLRGQCSDMLLCTSPTTVQITSPVTMSSNTAIDGANLLTVDFASSPLGSITVTGPVTEVSILGVLFTAATNSALTVTGGATLSLTRVAIVNCAGGAGSGGAVTVVEGELGIYQCYFADNVATAGQIASTASSKNSAQILLQRSTFYYSAINSNTAFVTGDVTLIVTQCLFYAENNIIVINSSVSDVTFRGSIFHSEVFANPGNTGTFLSNGDNIFTPYQSFVGISFSYTTDLNGDNITTVDSSPQPAPSLLTSYLLPLRGCAGINAVPGQYAFPDQIGQSTDLQGATDIGPVESNFLPGVTFSSSSLSFSKLDPLFIPIYKPYPSSLPVNVTCSPLDGTAKNGTDYVMEIQVVSWSAGNIDEMTCQFTILNDSPIWEPAKYFTVELTSVTGDILQGTMNITIVGDSTCNSTLNCTGHGSCNYTTNKCVCDPKFSGAFCNSCANGYFGYPNCQVCPVSCVHGTCDGWAGTCTCSSGFTGPACDTCISGFVGPFCNTTCNSTIQCNGNGMCNSTGGCTCATGFVGDTCSSCSINLYGLGCNISCNSSSCSGHGACNNMGGCTCDSGFVGASCSSCAVDLYGPACNISCSVLGCNGHGVCNSTGSCLCDTGYYGVFCDKKCNSTIDCSGNGVCNSTGGCTCGTGFTGPSCSSCSTGLFLPFCNSTCDATVTCHQHGTCNSTGGCNCLPGYLGPNCAISNTTICKCKVGEACCGVDCQPVSNTVMCRNITGDCDVPEYCTGSSGSCPADAHKPPTTVCRPSTGKCDLAEVCGGGASCPPDKVLTEDTCGVCGGDNSSCTSKGVCGDGFCNPTQNETCRTCVPDCNHCPNPDPCVGVICGNGTCDNSTGSCVCDDGWTGQACTTAIQPIAPAALPPGSGAGVTLGAKNSKKKRGIGAENSTTKRGSSAENSKTKRGSGTENSSITFSVAITKLQEVKADGTMVVSYDLLNSNLTAVESSSNGTSTFEYTITLDNGAYVTFSFATYSTTTQIDFANQTLTITPNTLKNTIQIFNWPFNGLSNRLQVWTDLQSDASKDACSNVTQQENDSGDVVWLQYTIQGHAIYSAFIDNAELDGVTKPMQIQSSSNTVYFTVPHFWTYAAIDPDYSVLFDVDSDTTKPGACAVAQHHSGGVSHKVIIATVVPIVSVAIIAGAVIYYFVRRHERDVAKQLDAAQHLDMDPI